MQASPERHSHALKAAKFVVIGNPTIRRGGCADVRGSRLNKVWVGRVHPLRWRGLSGARRLARALLQKR
jgi:hypothetical protein